MCPIMLILWLAFFELTQMTCSLWLFQALTFLANGIPIVLTLMILNPQFDFCNSETSYLCFLCKKPETSNVLLYILVLCFNFFFFFFKDTTWRLTCSNYCRIPLRILEIIPRFANFCYFYKTACALDECFCLIREN